MPTRGETSSYKTTVAMTNKSSVAAREIASSSHVHNVVNLLRLLGGTANFRLKEVPAPQNGPTFWDKMRGMIDC
jgi:hypothetical protein